MKLPPPFNCQDLLQDIKSYHGYLETLFAKQAFTKR